MLRNGNRAGDFAQGPVPPERRLIHRRASTRSSNAPTSTPCDPAGAPPARPINFTVVFDQALQDEPPGQRCRRHKPAFEIDDLIIGPRVKGRQSEPTPAFNRRRKSVAYRIDVAGSIAQTPRATSQATLVSPHDVSGAIIAALGGHSITMSKLGHLRPRSSWPSSLQARCPTFGDEILIAASCLAMVSTLKRRLKAKLFRLPVRQTDASITRSHVETHRAAPRSPIEGPRDRVVHPKMDKTMDNPPLALASTTIYQVLCVPPARFERATHGLGI